jgi:quinolinate synthase
MDLRDEVAARYLAVRHAIPPIEWPVYAGDVAEILDRKRRMRAAILAHNYQDPVIFHGVADVTGDSLALAERARSLDAEVLVVCGVNFMAETVKLLNPHRVVLIPDRSAGCSLAASISAADVRKLKRENPGVPVVSYVNTTVDVKAESTICCTSANAVEVVRSLRADRVLFVPDRYLAGYVAAQTDVEIVSWPGTCEVHERFTAGDIRELRALFPGVDVLAHPECNSGVLAEADFVGSTAGMIRRLREHMPPCAALITECAMSDNVAAEMPGVRFVRPCNFCPHMRKITLPSVRRSLETSTHEVTIDPEIAQRAKRAVDRMLEIGRGPSG